MDANAFGSEYERLEAVAFALGRALHPKAGGGFRISRWATGEHVDDADLAQVDQRLRLIERAERERRHRDYRDQAAHEQHHA